MGGEGDGALGDMGEGQEYSKVVGQGASNLALKVPCLHFQGRGEAPGAGVEEGMFGLSVV